MGMFDRLFGRRGDGDVQLDGARRRSIYTDFSQLHARLSDADVRQDLRNVALALAGIRQLDDNQEEEWRRSAAACRERALQQTARKHRISREQLDSIIEEATAQGW